MGAQATFLASRWARGCPKVAQDGISLVLPLTIILANPLEEHVGLELPSRGDKVSHNFLLGHPHTQELGSVGEAGPVRQEHKIRGGGGLPVVSVHGGSPPRLKGGGCGSLWFSNKYDLCLENCEASSSVSSYPTGNMLGILFTGSHSDHGIRLVGYLGCP